MMDENTVPLKEDSCVRRVPIFENLTESEMIALQDMVRSRRYAKGAFIFREGERSESLYILHSGVVKVSKCSGEGKEQVIRFLYRGDFLGQFSFLQDSTHYANAEVLEQASVCHIHKADFIKLMEKNPAMTYRFLLAICDRLQQADEWMSAIGLLDVEQRLAKTLLLFYQKEASPEPIIKLPIAKKELAALLSTTPETLSRKLAHFESQHIVAPESRNRLRILDLNKLMKIAGMSVRLISFLFIACPIDWPY